MSLIEFSLRIAPDAPAEHEWLYLVNETHIGEQCILPLLVDLADAPISAAFRRMIARQIEEEREHESLYRQTLGHDPLEGSGYDVEFTALVRGLELVTLRIFALQCLMEAIGIAAFEHRLSALTKSPTEATDRKILVDERRHAQFSHGYLRTLIACEGPVPLGEFDALAHRVNHLFARHFSARSVAETMRKQSGSECSVDSIATSEGMRRFSWRSASTIVAHKRDFVRRYRDAVQHA